jgi:uncharacterized membrane protein
VVKQAAPRVVRIDLVAQTRFGALTLLDSALELTAILRENPSAAGSNNASSASFDAVLETVQQICAVCADDAPLLLLSAVCNGQLLHADSLPCECIATCAALCAVHIFAALQASNCAIE